jgi:hypothetical protein
LSVSEAFRGVVDESVESTALASGINGFHLQPRCRVCRNDQVRTKVNDLLATGASYAMVLRALGDDNAKFEQRDRVTIDSIRNHTARHFPVQNVARATYREILERRAEENSVDFIEGVATTKHFPVQQTAHATYREILERRARENHVDFVEGVAVALTPIAFYEVVMTKAFRALVNNRTEVSVETGLRAAEKLQSVLDGRERGTDVLELKVQVGQISEAVRAVVPQSMWAAIVEKLEELEQPPEALDAETEAFDDDDEPYDPMEFIDEDAEF